jgi:hypothetical protein
MYLHVIKRFFYRPTSRIVKPRDICHLHIATGTGSIVISIYLGDNKGVQQLDEPHIFLVQI